MEAKEIISYLCFCTGKTVIVMFYKTNCCSETAQQEKSFNFSVHIIVVCCCGGDTVYCSMLSAVCCAQGLCSFEQFVVNMFIAEC